eukprot:3192820-Pyramimonas_sp.AAC.1
MDSGRWIDWRGDDLAALDIPPPKAKKAEDAAAANSSFYDPVSAKAAGATLVHTDRSYPVPPGQSAWGRRDANAKHFRPSLPSGPDRRSVARRVTIDYDTWE